MSEDTDMYLIRTEWGNMVTTSWKLSCSEQPIFKYKLRTI